MAATRERRVNAGNRISNLLNEEEEDEEIYKTLYGGFQETADDKDYIQNYKDDDEDSVDSDFSIDENDEAISEAEEKEDAKPKMRNVYKDSKRKMPANKANKVKTVKKANASNRFKSKRVHRSSYTVLDSGRISLRHSTALKSAATQHRVKERKEAMRKRPKSYRIVDVMPTQKELLAEAETTAKENLASLERFRKMEIEKKKVRPTKRQNTGPIIRYHSLSMPSVVDTKHSGYPKRKTSSQTNQSINGDVLMDMDIELNQTRLDHNTSSSSSSVQNAEFSSKRIERTFITFENDVSDEYFAEMFNKSPAKKKSELICALTRLPAKYIDPHTKLPYRNVQALKIIREAYYQLAESSLPPNDSWVQWRRKTKENAKTE